MKLGIVICQVSDMDRAVGFYRDVLGLTAKMVTPHWSQFDVGGFTLGLHPIFADGGSSGKGGWLIGFETEDLVGLRKKLIETGVEVKEYHQVPGAVVFDFTDYDGNPIEATQPGLTMEQIRALEAV